MNVHNPSEQIDIRLPFRMIITDSNVSTTTSLLLDLIQKIDKFETVYVISEDLTGTQCHSLLQQDDIKIVFLNDLPLWDTFDDKKNTLVIFDNLICKTDQDVAKTFRLRLQAEYNTISTILLSSTYKKIHKTIRNSYTYFIGKLITRTDYDLMQQENCAMWNLTFYAAMQQDWFLLSSGKSIHHDFQPAFINVK